MYIFNKIHLLLNKISVLLFDKKNKNKNIVYKLFVNVVKRRIDKCVIQVHYYLI